MILVTASSVLFQCLKASTVCESTDTWMTGNQSGVSYTAKVGHEENICQGDKESLQFKFSQTSIK